ncbi:hypothetical protein C1645_745157 [Glomus cerebriforme]|uniref:DUF659 domain-containing protein n=1 Tax=Glomus cerebriforme TaxID=658196 RepID=A0A397S731_9GLOM|nr:hypothetical protein C1645_745157 [Glomus cerebriforme]
MYYCNGTHLLFKVIMDIKLGLGKFQILSDSGLRVSEVTKVWAGFRASSKKEIDEIKNNKRAKVTSIQAVKRQASLTNYVSRPLSAQDIPHFHQLFFNMYLLHASEGKSLTWDAKNISSERSKTSDVISHIKDIIEQAHKHQINIKCFVSDSAGEYATARCQICIEYKDKIFLPCMAHQMNLVFGDIFKESKKYKKILTKAIQIVSIFHMAPYFAGNLRDEQMLIYNKTISLARPGNLWWNNYYFYYYSLLKTKAALKDIISFWESCLGHTPELSCLALHLYSICVNDSVEQLWFTMGFFHTKRRN